MGVDDVYEDLYEDEDTQDTHDTTEATSVTDFVTEESTVEDTTEYQEKTAVVEEASTLLPDLPEINKDAVDDSTAFEGDDFNQHNVRDLSQQELASQSDNKDDNDEKDVE